MQFGVNMARSYKLGYKSRYFSVTYTPDCTKTWNYRFPKSFRK